MNKKFLSEVVLLVVITILTLCLRIFRAPELVQYTYDQGRDMIAVSSIANGDLRLLGPSTGGVDGFFLGPFYFYFLLPGFIISGGSPIGTTLWLTICYTLTLPIAYYLLKPMVGKKLALFGFLLLCISSGSIIESQLMWNPSLAAPTLLISWFFLFRSKQNQFLLAPALFFFGLTLQTELGYGLLLIPVYFWWIVVHSPLVMYLSNRLVKAKKQLYSWPALLCSIFIAGTTLIPQLIFELKNKFLLSNALLDQIASKNETISLFQIWDMRPEQLAASMYKYLFGFAPGHQLFLILLILGVAYISFKIVTLSEKFLFLVFVTPLALSMFYGGGHGDFYPYYLSAHYLAVCLLAPIAIHRLRSRKTKISAVIGISTVALLCFSWTVKMTYFTTHEYTFNHQLNAYLKARELAGESHTIEVFTPNLQPIQYDYINTWYSKQNNVEPLSLNNNTVGATTVALLYEPPFSGGSLSAFKDWYKRSIQNKACDSTEHFGFITVEKCKSL